MVPLGGLGYPTGMTLIALIAIVLTSVAHAQADWEAVLARATPAIVSLRVNAQRAFDTEQASSTVGTGFVVDAERGIILTNRHLVETGPVRAEAVFLNHEVVPLQPLYRDPVHDFAFYRFDPTLVRFQEVVELPLDPDGARVGTEVRVVGNDAGEKLSIHGATLARLDRQAPSYGADSYNDFNTFYYQAASGTTGGSSGSPVLDGSGAVVALNAGAARRSQAAFFLPLHPVQSALEHLQAGRAPPRGTLQVTFQHATFDEARRLGLSAESEERVRREVPGATGLLVVERVGPGGPADGALRPGDVLLEVDGTLVTAFLPLEQRLDGGVGGAVRLALERSGKPVLAGFTVGDLHAITPSTFLEVGNGVVHPVSYQLARNAGAPVEGLVVATPGTLFGSGAVPAGSRLLTVAGQEVPTLDELWRVLGEQPDGARITVRTASLGPPRREEVAIVTVDRRWFPLRRCSRIDDLDSVEVGEWTCEEAPPPVSRATPVGGSTALEGEGRQARALASSLVLVELDIPFRVEGVWGSRFRGAGLVLDAERGLVATDRDTVPVALGDVTLTFAGAVRVPAKVVRVHPVHDLALVQYDPALLGDTPVRSATLTPRKLEPGDEVWSVGLDTRGVVAARRTRVARGEALRLPLPSPPQYRAINVDVFDLEDAAPSVGGVVADRRGRVLGLWSSFHSDTPDGALGLMRGWSVEPAQALLAEARGERGPWRTLGVEWAPLPLADARELGVDATWADALETHDPKGRQVLSVERLAAGGPSAGVLRPGDVLLSVNGQVATRFHEVEAATQAGAVRLRVLRDGAVLPVDLTPAPVGTTGLDELILWAGAVLHAPHPELALQRGVKPLGVYVSWFWFGSPAAQDGLRGTLRVLAVDDVPTPTLQAFLDAVSGRPDRAVVRLQVVDLDGRERVLPVDLDLDFWPTARFQRTEQGWERSAVP